MHRRGLCLVLTRGHVNKIHMDSVSSSNRDLSQLWVTAVPSLPSPCKGRSLRFARLPLSEVRSPLMCNEL